MTCRVKTLVAVFWGCVAFGLVPPQLSLVPGLHATFQWYYGLASGVATAIGCYYVTSRGLITVIRPKETSAWVKMGTCAGLSASIGGSLTFAVDVVVRTLASGFTYPDLWYWGLAFVTMFAFAFLATFLIAVAEGALVAVLTIPVVKVALAFVGGDS